MKSMCRTLLMITPLCLMGCDKQIQFEKIPGGPLQSVQQDGTSHGDATKDPAPLPSRFEKVQEGFVQPSTQPMVDIIFVVDNSASMAKEQEELGDKIGSFLDHFDGIDWHIGITTTDVSNGSHGIKGSLIPLDSGGNFILNRNVRSYEELFKTKVVRSETVNCGQACPSADEQALLASIMAMEKSSSDNRRFFREDADLIFVYLSDEDEKSTGPADATAPQEVIAAKNQIFGHDKGIKAYGIVIEPGDQQCLAQANGRFGTFVSEFARITAGSTGSICDSSYSSSLSRIGADIERHLSAFVLSSKPVIENQEDFEVTLRPQVPGATWELKGKNLHFSVQLPPETEILVSYKKERE